MIWFSLECCIRSPVVNEEAQGSASFWGAYRWWSPVRSDWFSSFRLEHPCDFNALKCLDICSSSVCDRLYKRCLVRKIETMFRHICSPYVTIPQIRKRFQHSDKCLPVFGVVLWRVEFFLHALYICCNSDIEAFLSRLFWSSRFPFDLQWAAANMLSILSENIPGVWSSLSRQAMTGDAAIPYAGNITFVSAGVYTENWKKWPGKCAYL